MEDFRGLYFSVYGKMSDAVDAIEMQNYGHARQILVDAMMQGEEDFIKQADIEEEGC